MTDQKLQIGGLMAYWKLSPKTSLAQLADGLERLGYKDLIPEVPSVLSRLRRALAELFVPPDKDHRYVVRPIKNEHPGFAVVSEAPKEHAHAGDDWGKVVATATLLNEDTGEFDLDPLDYEKRRGIQEYMDDAAHYLSNDSVVSILTTIIEKLEGTTMRDGGGLYWLFDSEYDEWKRVGNLVEAASAEPGKNRVYAPRLVADEEMVKAVGDSLTLEVEQAVAKIEAEVQGGDLKEQACLRRMVQAGNLGEKVKRYEAAFGEPLERLREACQRAVAAAAMATLQVSAAQSGPVLTGAGA